MTYTTQAPIKADYDYDWYPECSSITVTENTDPIDTGLVDQFGVKIWKVTDRLPMGFCR